MLAAILLSPVNAGAAQQLASSGTNSARVADRALPSLLPEADATRYREIFALQAQGEWAAADGQIADLTDKLLLAPVLAQRYLSPNYRATYEELNAWLSAYAEAPDASAIYALAAKRHPQGAPPPARPVIGNGASFAEAAMSSRDMGGDTDGGDEEATDSGRGNGDWIAGLAAWRANRVEKARHEFEGAARSGRQSPATVSAAAFWAARTELRGGHPELVNHWLGIAAKNSHTFYGLLARRTLGIDTYIDFDATGFGELDAQIISGIPAGRRALGLIQIGETKRAEAELRALTLRASPNVLRSVVTLADRTNMASLNAEIAARVAGDEDRNNDRAQFPVPNWKPRGGFQIDRALIFGLVRQESKFHPVARNRSGAAGLMQLMPSTARTMAARTGLSAREISDPSVNLALGQEYVIELLNDSRVNGNLFYFAVAYNRGPGALPSVQTHAGSQADPLLFIESITNRETRSFIHQVMTNYWVYRLRLGQSTPDLDALAAGEWPIYTALDDRVMPAVRHADNR